jgi:hypothetical protein
LVRPTNVFLVTGASLGLPSWQPYMNVLKALSVHHRVPIVDLTLTQRSAVKEMKVTREDLLMDKMHPTPLANDMIAADWQAALFDAGWPTSRLVGDMAPAVLTHIEDIPTPTAKDVSFGSPQRSLFPETEGEEATWTLTGSLISGNLPVHIDLLAVDGRTVARHDLAAAGPFAFVVPMSAGHITLEGWSEAGERVRMEVITGTADVELNVP